MSRLDSTRTANHQVQQSYKYDSHRDESLLFRLSSVRSVLQLTDLRRMTVY